MSYTKVRTVTLVCCAVCVSWLVISANAQEQQGRQICVVGAGVAGLVTAQQLLAAGQPVTVLEAQPKIGGTWYQEPRVGRDEYGRPIHSSMYKNLRTNVPRHLMELPDFPMPPGTPSFPTGPAYYQYLIKFTDHFNLWPHIKLLHEVVLVSRVGNFWRVVYKDLNTDTYQERYFHYVIISVGHYSKPNVPNIPGANLFRGSMIHSHDYREPEPYTNRRMLIIGAGPSGLDLAITFTNYCRRVVHSHHSDHVFTPFPSNYVHKPDVVQFTANGAIFKDGSFEEVDDVMFATGYEFNFPFLDQSSGLTLKKNYLAPLYNHVVNVHQPTMLFVGLSFRACSILTIVTQARYAASIALGRATLPSQDDMKRAWQSRVDALAAKGARPTDIHAVDTGLESVRYYHNVTAEGHLPDVPPVLSAICATDGHAKNLNFYTFRDYEYILNSDGQFSRVLSRVQYNNDVNTVGSIYTPPVRNIYSVA